MTTNCKAEIEEYANDLTSAWKAGEGDQPVTARDPELSMDEAYRVQLQMVDGNIKSGQKVTGKKIGLTSKAMQELLGVDEPDYGHLLDRMEVRNGEAIPFKKV